MDNGRGDRICGLARRIYLELRLNPIFLGGDPRRGQDAVRCLLRNREDRRARFEQAWVPGDITEDLALGPDNEFGLSALEADLHELIAGRLDDARDGSVGHGAVRDRIPWKLPFGDTPQRVGKDAQFDAMELAIGAFESGRGDVIVGLDVRDGLVDQRRYAEIVGKGYRQRLAVAPFDRQHLAIKLLNSAANADRLKWSDAQTSKCTAIRARGRANYADCRCSRP